MVVVPPITNTSDTGAAELGCLIVVWPSTTTISGVGADPRVGSLTKRYPDPGVNCGDDTVGVVMSESNVIDGDSVGSSIGVGIGVGIGTGFGVV